LVEGLKKLKSPGVLTDFEVRFLPSALANHAGLFLLHHLSRELAAMISGSKDSPIILEWQLIVRAKTVTPEGQPTRFCCAIDIPTRAICKFLFDLSQASII